jgi:hypothetical protein
MDITRGDRFVIGAVPGGNRVVAVASAGTVTGERIAGTLVGPGADWTVLGADGVAQIDVRTQIGTPDGATIYVQYVGVLELNDRVGAALRDPALETSFDDQYCRTTMRLESGHERYAWVNRTVFVARGRLIGSGVHYEVYRL